MKNTNKICTDIKQSKKLIELGVDVTTADMHYMYRHWEIDEDTVGSQSDASIGFDSDFYYGVDNSKTYHYIPAWSLSALLDLMPYEITIKGDNTPYRLLVTHKLVHYPRLTTMWPSIYSVEANTTLDAAFEVICELLEDKIIYKK